jgi:hypothetical protein
MGYNQLHEFKIYQGAEKSITVKRCIHKKIQDWRFHSISNKAYILLYRNNRNNMERESLGE